jgi:subtilisin family serine protease
VPRRNAKLAAVSGRLVRTFAALDVHQISLPVQSDVDAIARVLASDPDVLVAQPNYERHITATAPPNDPYWISDYMWGLQKIKMPAVWTNFGSGDGSVVIADIDTGVNYNHPDLAQNIWTNPGEVPGNGVDDDANGYIDDVHGIDTVNGDSDPMDDNGHGTHTAGTIAAVGNNGVGVVGVNWNARVLACKFLRADGSGYDSGAIACFEYIVALRNRGVNIRVTNNSWGAARDGGVSTLLKNAIDAAGNVGIVNVFAAGNAGVNIEVTPFDPASFISPSIISVAASDQNDNRAAFSNYGPISVDIAAPGVGILSTYGSGYAGSDGTSMAAPHVAGAAALLFSSKPELSVSALKSFMLNNVDRSGPWAGVVASGGRLDVSLMFLAAYPNQAPTVTLTGPTNGATYTAPATIALSATAGDSDGTVTQVAFYAGTTLLVTVPRVPGELQTAPYVATWSSVPVGTYAVTAVATDNGGATKTSAVATITVTGSGSGGATATFVGTDTTTQGNWKTTYGNQGYVLANDGTSLPVGATVTTTAQGSWSYASSTTDIRALQKAAAADRIAATWYGGSFTIDVNPGDTQPHRLSLYLLDWDSGGGRRETVDIVNPATGAVLDTRTAQSFAGGQYWTWLITGTVRVRVTLTVGLNAVVSGIFLDPGNGNQVPTVTLTGPANGATYTAPATIALSATAGDSDGTVTQVAFYAGTTLLATVPRVPGELQTDPYVATWSSVPVGTYAVTAVATDNGGATKTSTAATITVTGSGSGGATASFVGTDTTTQGNWKTTYGNQGYVLANDGTNLPVGATVTTTAQGSWSWAPSTTDIRALQKAGAADRIAATWYGGSFTIDVNPGDTQPHRLALYLLDWDGGGRRETVDIVNPATGAVLDTRTAQSFAGGQYWVWQVSGTVRVRLTLTVGLNAVVSGIFLDP